MIKRPSTYFNHFSTWVSYPRKRKSKKITPADEMCVCDFTVGQMLQHVYRPSIKMLLVTDPKRTIIVRYGRRHVAWKLRVFTIRQGNLGGKIKNKVIRQMDLKRYKVISDIDVSSSSLPEIAESAMVEGDGRND